MRGGFGSQISHGVDDELSSVSGLNSARAETLYQEMTTVMVRNRSMSDAGPCAFSAILHLNHRLDDILNMEICG
jgi:hypothetical protein